MDDKNTFHLGLTMAGAVSGGAYTAGVMDYFFEALDKWQKAKDGLDIGLSETDKQLIPQHKVSIDVMGGTSAGGMTTIMAAIYGLQNKIQPITEPQQGHDKTGNIFFDTWVNMLDDEQGNTLQKAFGIEDLKDGKLYALLNSNFIDSLADSAFQQINTILQPAYIAPSMEMLITHTMNRGIPLSVDFPNNTQLSGSLKDPPPNSTTYEHHMISHFKIGDHSEDYLNLDPSDPLVIDRLRKAAKATGAFPIGLIYRDFSSADFKVPYLKSELKRIITRKHNEASPTFNGDIEPVWNTETLDILRNYKTTSVDGGAINNEPYGEVLEILKENPQDNYIWPIEENSTEAADQQEYQKSGVIMIDPFPDIVEDDPEYQHPQELFGVLSKIIKTLWNQSKVKRKEMREQYDNKAFRGTIFPVKHKVVNGNSIGKYKYPLASGTLGAFGGFLDRSFRQHDYFLGRNNARNFLRNIFSMRYDPNNNIIHPIHRAPYWTDAMKERFIIKYAGNTYLPVIPDMNILLNELEESKSENLTYTVNEFPKLKRSFIDDQYKKLLNKRINRLIAVLRSQLKNGFSIGIRFINWSFRIHKKLTKKVIEIIEEDLKKHGFLEGSDNIYIKKKDNSHLPNE